MAVADLLRSFSTTEHGIKPRDDEVDLFGVTHPGHIRKENQDHFLAATVHQQIVLHGTSLPGADQLPMRSQRLGTMMMVADGVGGGADGGDASLLAVASITNYVASSMRCFHSAGHQAEDQFLAELRAAALEAHDAVRAESATRVSNDPRPRSKSMATTLTLAMVVWPSVYVVQVGDSRCYHYQVREKKLRKQTRDQTLAQDLVDKGALPADRAANSPFAHVLASAIGGREAMPDVTTFMVGPGDVLLLCSDGLTKHVTDEQIAEACRTQKGSEQLARTLLEMALAGGGSDNVTVLAGQAHRRA
jgi:protein phosphatase